MKNKRQFIIRQITIALALLALAAGAAAIFAPSDTTGIAVPEKPLHAQSVSLVRVVDGDTIVVRLADGREETVRYVGIDAPEYNARTDEGQAFGREALDANVALLGNGPLWIGLDREHRDQYGRLLAYVFTDDEFVNGALLRDGLAQALIIPPNDKHIEPLLQLQAEALQQRRGLWQAAADNVIDWRDAASAIDEAATVEGVITRTHKDPNSGITFLNFSQNIREDFVAIISEVYAERFSQPPESNYSGHRVRIQGIVQSYEGQPQIFVQIPQQIEVID